jgi:cystathionine beta-lyase/cystathionine gamma-synthase
MPEIPGPEGSPHPETTAIRAGRDHDGTSLAPVLWPSTTYVVDDLDESARLARTPRATNFYSRNGSPTVNQFEEAVAELEGAEAALAAGSGMGTIATVVLGLCSSGDHIVAQDRTFAVTNQLFTNVCPRFGIDVTFVDATDPTALHEAVIPGRTSLVFVETPANPGMALVDLDAVGSIVGPFTVVDSTFATPAVQRPLDHGVDLVVHAATKGIAGHNDAMLGVVAGERELIDALWGYHLVHGAVASPFDAWNGLRGIRTLFARHRQQAETAQRLAEALAEHPRVAGVHYPGLDGHPQRDLAKRQMRDGGTLLALDLAGGFDAGRAFVAGCRIAQPAPSLGGPETLVTHVPSMTAATMHPEDRSAMGISDGLVRVSVGLEHPDDLVADLLGAIPDDTG